jgi:hypothetical protein
MAMENQAATDKAAHEAAMAEHLAQQARAATLVACAAKGEAQAAAKAAKGSMSDRGSTTIQD